MDFIRRQTFGFHVPFVTVPPGFEMEWRARPWDPVTIVDPAAGVIHIELAGRRRAFDAFAMLVLTAFGVMIMVSLSWKGRS